MNEECLICGAPLEYLNAAEMMECALCGIDLTKENFGIEMEKHNIICRYSAQNSQCIGRRCPFSRPITAV